jgi:superfamily II DNA or RNA helicase
MLKLRSPTQIQIIGHEGNLGKLREFLKYTDKKVDWEIKSALAGRRWFVQKYGQEAFTNRLKALKEEQHKQLLFEDETGIWTYSGLQKQVSEILDDDDVQKTFKLPQHKLIPWATVPENDDRYYQVLAHDALLAEGHAAVEIGTGLGKSRIIRNLLKTIGLQAVVMAPSKSIAEQLYDDLSKHFGKARVGYVGDGKKDFKKLITVAIGASLTRMAPDSPAWKVLSKAQVFVSDESHMCPAATLQKVCFGLVANAPYRFFFSGTQMRNDGLDLVLEGITGPIVYRKTVQEGVDEGFLSKPVFRMIWANTDSEFDSKDANDMTRAHVFYNNTITARAAEIANKSVSLQGRPTVILIDELEQLSYLLPHLRYETRFAHGGVTKENKEKIPPEFHDSDPKALVAAFNRGEFPILVGTSCIVMGTDITRVGSILYLRGGKSEIEVRQAVGRGTRLFPGKANCTFIDFGIANVEVLKKHALARRKIYQDIYPSYAEIGP